MSTPIHLFNDICRGHSRITTMKAADRKQPQVRDSFMALQTHALGLVSLVAPGPNHHAALWSAATSASLAVIEAFPEMHHGVFEIMAPKSAVQQWVRHIPVSHLEALTFRGLSMHATISDLTIRALRGKDTIDLQNWVLHNSAARDTALNSLGAFTAQNIAMSPAFTAKWMSTSIASDPPGARQMLDQCAALENGLHFVLLEKAGVKLPSNISSGAKRRIDKLTNHHRMTFPAFRHGQDIAAFCADKEAVASARKLFKSGVLS